MKWARAKPRGIPSLGPTARGCKGESKLTETPAVRLDPLVLALEPCLLLMAARTLRARKPELNSGAFGVDASHCLPESTVPLARWRSKLPLSEVVCNSFCLVRRLLHQGRIART